MFQKWWQIAQLGASKTKMLHCKSIFCYYNCFYTIRLKVNSKDPESVLVPGVRLGLAIGASLANIWI